MPNRILRDCTDSEPVNRLSVHAERLFYRLIQKADDYGRLTGNAKLLRPLLFPLQLDQVRDSDLQRWLTECEAAGLVRLYEAEAKSYMEIVKFGQRVRAEKSKFPEPPPSSGSHLSVKRPSSVSSAPLKTKSETETESKAQTKAGEFPASLESTEFRKAWEEFQEYRSQRHQKLTPIGERKLLAKLAVWGIARSVAAINATIENGWQGIYEPKTNGHRSHARSSATAKVDS